MGTIRVSLFGGFRVLSNGTDLTSLYPPKVQELFSYLLLYRDKVHARESLASTLWTHGSAIQSKKCLRQALWRLQTTLDLHTEHDHTLRSMSDEIELNIRSSISLDVAVFEQAIFGAQGAPERELDDSQVQALCRAADLYKGDLLEGWYHDWTLYERSRFQNDYLAMLDKLMACCEARREFEAGLAYGATSLRYDRARERTHRRLMRLYYLAGDRTGALRQYDLCVKALNEELGVEPGKRTTMLYQQIRADNLASQQPTETDVRRAEPLSSLPAALQRLKHYLWALDELQQQVKHTILAVEALLSQRTE